MRGEVEMEITLEMIDMIRKRTNVSYKDAKEALEKYDGEPVGALAYLDEMGKIKYEERRCHGAEVKGRIRRWIERGNEIKIKLSKDEKVVMNLPMNIILLGAIFAFPFMVGALILSVLLGYKVEMKDDGKGKIITDLSEIIPKEETAK